MNYRTEIKTLPTRETEQWLNISGKDVLVVQADQEAYRRVFNGQEPNSEIWISPKIERNKTISFVRFGFNSDAVSIIIDDKDISIPLDAFNEAAKFLNYSHL